MKRKWIVLAAVCLIFAAGVAAALFWPKGSAVAECNAHSEFIAPLTTPANQVTGLENAERSEGFGGGYALSLDDVAYCIGGYPDVLDDLHVTDIQIRSDACAVYGVRVGDPVADGEKTLETWGYRGENSMVYGWVYRKQDIAIELSANEEGIIWFIRVMVDVTNKENVCF